VSRWRWIWKCDKVLFVYHKSTWPRKKSMYCLTFDGSQLLMDSFCSIQSGLS
jgi:hypothetical protein